VGLVGLIRLARRHLLPGAGRPLPVTPGF